jgi:hypothetical protein
LKEIVDPVNTMSRHAVHLTLSSDPAVRMIVAFRRADEDARIALTGIGSGDLIANGELIVWKTQLRSSRRIAALAGWLHRARRDET